MLHMLGQAALARSLFPVGVASEGRRPAALAEAFGLPVATQARFPGAVLRAERRRGRLRPVDRARPWCGAAARWSIPTGRCSANTTGRSRSRSGQRRGLGVAIGEPAYVLDVDALREPRRGGAAACCWLDGGWSPTARRGSPVGRPPTGRSRPQVRIRYRARMPRPSSSPPPVASAWSSAKPSAPSRRARARWSTAATRCSAAAASSSRYAEPFQEESDRMTDHPERHRRLERRSTRSTPATSPRCSSCSTTRSCGTHPAPAGSPASSRASGGHRPVPPDGRGRGVTSFDDPRRDRQRRARGGPREGDGHRGRRHAATQDPQVQVMHVRDGKVTEFWGMNQDQAAMDVVLGA